MRDAGLTDARNVQGVFSHLLTLVTFGSAGWGYALGKKETQVIKSNKVL